MALNPWQKQCQDGLKKDLTILDKSMRKNSKKLTHDESAFIWLLNLSANEKVLNLIEDPSGLIKHQNRAILLVCV